MLKTPNTSGKCSVRLFCTKSALKSVIWHSSLPSSESRGSIWQIPSTDKPCFPFSVWNNKHFTSLLEWVKISRAKPGVRRRWTKKTSVLYLVLIINLLQQKKLGNCSKLLEQLFPIISLLKCSLGLKENCTVFIVLVAAFMFCNSVFWLGVSFVGIFGSGVEGADHC